MMADYNGWTDAREEEREALDQFEVALTAAARGLLARSAARRCGDGSAIMPMGSGDLFVSAAA
jgi:hypothetical protein